MKLTSVNEVLTFAIRKKPMQRPFTEWPQSVPIRE